MMMRYLKVCNWSEYQHYKDRNPPWIKLSTDIFQKYEISRLQDASKLLAICIITLASRYKDPKKGLVPYDLDWIKNQCGLRETITDECVQELVGIGFIEIASKALASCKQNARPETETETETETESETERAALRGRAGARATGVRIRTDAQEGAKARARALPASATKRTRARKGAAEFALPKVVNPETWTAYEEMRRKIRKPMTNAAKVLAIKKLEKIIKNTGNDPNDVIEQSILNSWQGLFPVRNEKNPNEQTKHGEFERQDYRESEAAKGFEIS